MRSARLQGAIMVGANLWEALLLGAELQGAHLQGANLEGALLMKANLQGALHLTQEQINSTAMGDNDTKLPDNLRHPTHWGKRIEALHAPPFR
jgi:uncharacterized protein YjbI with pentapeptide repeats